MKKLIALFFYFVLSIPLYFGNIIENKSYFNESINSEDDSIEICSTDEFNSLPCGSITGFKIYDQITDAEVPDIGFLFSGILLDINDLPANYYLVVETEGIIESVKIYVDGSDQLIENQQPYTYPSGAESGASWNSGIGVYNLDARAYEYDNGNNLCSSSFLTFSIFDGNCVNDFDCDGVPNDNDCAPYDVTIFEGATCDDGDNSTVNDLIQFDCSCIGIPELSTHFVTTWKTDNLSLGSSNIHSITIPTYQGDENPEVYNYDVDWNNDGIFDELGITGNVTHDYGIGNEGIHTIRIKGDFPRIYFNLEGDNQKLLNVDQWGSGRWTSMNRAFSGCINFGANPSESAMDVPDLTYVTDMSRMLNLAFDFNQNIGNWDVSNVTDMSYVFNSAKSFNQDISDWDVSNVTDMTYIFLNAHDFNTDIGLWDVSSVTNMFGMFEHAMTFNQDIGDWDVSAVTSMQYMFKNADVFNQDIGDWDVSNVSRMSLMFFRAHLFNQDIGEWNVGNVTAMSSMFNKADAFNQDINSWDVSSVLFMSSMFKDAVSFNSNIGSWEVNQVLEMNRMFEGAISFNQDISNWNVENVTNMSAMFRSCESFDQNLGTWDVSAVTDMTQMFNFISLSTAFYDSLLIGWSNRNLSQSVVFNGGSSLYCEGTDARQSILDNFGWTITDGGIVDSSCLLNCPTDFDGNGITNGDDFRIFQGNFGMTCGDSFCQTDLNMDDETNGFDFMIFLGSFGLNCE